MVAVLDVQYVRYGYLDLARAEKFLTDFGMSATDRTQTEVHMRGANGTRYCFVASSAGDPGLQAIGMRAANLAALESAAAFPEASEIETIDGAGGGHVVRLASPDGVPFELVHGISDVAPTAMRAALSYNHAQQKSREGEWQRPPLEPAQVLRLGHIAIMTANYAANAEWLGTRFDMRPSDVLFDGDEANEIGGFFHCGAASGWTDHHSLALFPAQESKVHHCSFEVQDVDAQFMGNKFLLSRGWSPLWGVGRHILGSQIFDYWFDPEGNVIEHFTDGDLVRAGKEVEYHQVSDDSLAQWGPPMAVGNFIDRVAMTG